MGMSPQNILAIQWNSVGRNLSPLSAKLLILLTCRSPAGTAILVFFSLIFLDIFAVFLPPAGKWETPCSISVRCGNYGALRLLPLAGQHRARGRRRRGRPLDERECLETKKRAEAPL